MLLSNRRNAKSLGCCAVVWKKPAVPPSYQKDTLSGENKGRTILSFNVFMRLWLCGRHNF
jgi:hypothetical protein